MKRLELGSVKNIDVATHLSHCIHRIEELIIVKFRLTEEGFAALVDKIRQLAKPVKYCGMLYRLIAIRNVNNEVKLPILEHIRLAL